MQKLILFCVVFFSVAACSKKALDNDPVLYQLKLSDYKGLWELELAAPISPRYAANAKFNFTIQDQHNFVITFPSGRTPGDTTISGMWKLSDDGDNGFIANYLDRTDTIILESKTLYKKNNKVSFDGFFLRKQLGDYSKHITGEKQ